uniref:Chromosome 1 open reading frame 112 n=1 Tax=Varanus komodoensis TaxID=61221 RepID=A0A8D2LCI0_VARKO
MVRSHCSPPYHPWIDFSVLRTITERFLPHLNISELEQAFFSKILPKTVQLFDLLTYEISSQAKQLTKQNVELHETLRNHLQALVHVLEALTGCVRHICAAQETVPLEHVHSLPSSVLHVIKSAFMHCKNSESLYNDCLHLFSDLLQTLFKEGYALQKQLMELLEMVSVDSCTAEDSAAVMVSVIHSVLEICSAISRIDHALHANTWKFIIRQSLKHKSLIKNSLKHSDIFSSLCEDILFYFQSCLQLAEQMKRSGTQENTDYKLFQRTIKLCRFFANSLAHYTKEFTPFLADSCPQLHRTYLEIYSKLPPSLHAPVISEAHQDEIAKGFLVVLDSLLPKLLSSRPFLEVVLSTTLDLAPELHLPQCRLLLSVMDLLPSQPQDVQALWNAGSRLPQAFPRYFLAAEGGDLLDSACPVLASPWDTLTRPYQGKQADGPVTFYHYTCVHLCAFITSLPEAPLLLLAVLGWSSAGAPLVSVFLRFSQNPLVSPLPLSPPLQAAFTQNFSPKDAENLPLWQHLSLLALVPVLRQQVAHELFAAGLGQCQEWLSSERLTEELPRVNAALAALLSACQTAGEALEEGQRATLVDTLRQLLGALPPAQVRAPSLPLRAVLSSLSLLQLNPPDHLLMATLDFLSSMGKAIIPPNFQVNVLPKLSCLFSSLLASGSWLIQQHAVEAFTQFAEGTSHENLLPQCLNNEEIKSTVVRFLSKVFLH